jgi:hypothetical protein
MTGYITAFEGMPPVQLTIGAPLPMYNLIEIPFCPKGTLLDYVIEALKKGFSPILQRYLCACAA